VERRLKTYGRNELPTHAFSTTQVVIRQFKNPIFAILIACAVIAGLYEAPEQAIIILLMIAISVVLGFYNEYKAERIVENLRQNVAIKAVVTRDGKSAQIDSRQLVPGDLVSVYVGDIVPADMRLVKCTDLQTDEATFTGESFPVEKTPEPIKLERQPLNSLRTVFSWVQWLCTEAVRVLWSRLERPRS